MISPYQTYPEFNAPEADHSFLETEHDTFTYRTLFQFQSGFLDYLKQQDYQKGQRILLVSDLSPSLVFCIAACWNLHIPYIPLSPRKYARMSEEHVKNLEADHLFINSEESSLYSGTPLSRQFLENRIRDGKEHPVRNYSNNSGDEEDILGIYHSSGTSGTPKQIPLKRRQVYHGARAAAGYLKPDPGQSWLLCLSPCHIGGTAVILRSILYGSGIFLIPEFEVDKVSKLLSTPSRIQAASMVPTMLKRLLDQGEFKTHRAMKGMLIGGGPIDSKLIERSTDRNIPVIASYGMTETCAQITANPYFKNQKSAVTGNVGKVFKPNQVQIRDERGKTVQKRQTGLIWLKGPQIFDGYLDPDLNNRLFDKKEWFNTGDYGFLDNDGRLNVEMRRTDQIVSGGRNINPHEIETMLRSWEPIRDIAVVGHPDPEWGEIVTAFIVPGTSREKLTIKAIKSYLQGKVESYKIPKKIILKTQLPKTSIGKIKRSDLKKEIRSSEF